MEPIHYLKKKKKVVRGWEKCLILCLWEHAFHVMRTSQMASPAQSCHTSQKYYPGDKHLIHGTLKDMHYAKCGDMDKCIYTSTKALRKAEPILLFANLSHKPCYWWLKAFRKLWVCWVYEKEPMRRVSQSFVLRLHITETITRKRILGHSIKTPKF